MFDYTITWPLWLLTTEDSIVRDEQGVPVGLTARPGFDAIRDGDKCRLIAITDQDLAERYVTRHKAKWVPVSFNSPDNFVEWLESLEDEGVTSVFFDPEPVGTIYSIGSVIAALQRGPI
jgi:hypothetical protein